MSTNRTVSSEDEMIKLNLPQFSFRVKEENENTLIWDSYRKIYVRLTPEEWVRQHFAKFLETNLQYPKSLIKLESSLSYNQRTKRPDIVCYGHSGEPLLLVECKSHKIEINKSAVIQASVYNKIIKAKYLVVTNGMEHYCWEQNFENNQIELLDKIPVFSPS